MRYAVVEFFFENTKDPTTAVFRWVMRDLSQTSAADCAKAWGYQAGQKGGYMQVVEDRDAALAEFERERREYHPKFDSIREEAKS